MAPQQNSTFINDDSTLHSKLHKKNDDEEEIIRRYSPILPLKITQSNELPKQDCNESSKGKKYSQTKKIQDELPEHRKSYVKKCQNGIANEKRFNGNHASQCCQSQSQRRNRSVSVHGINSTISTEKEQREITIWLGNEPRYVSGVTKKTTCNDIIKALIDDEIQNGNYQHLKSFKVQCTSTHNHRKDGGDGVCATSRDYSDYVITESWRGIERSYDDNMTILPVWKAWNRVHNEIRLRLRHRSEIAEQIQNAKPRSNPNRISILKKCFNKLRRLWRRDKLESACAKPTQMKENCLQMNHANIPDEILFIILPDKVYKSERAQTLQPIPEQSNPRTHNNKQGRSKLLTRKKKSANRSRKMHERGSVSKVNATNNCIHRRQLSKARNTIRSSIRYRLAQKTSAIDELYAREYALTRELSEKCKLYKEQNQIYSNPDQQLNISIGQVQRKIENYAKEIVRTEQELLELKNEIKHDISTINNLKRVTLQREGIEQKIMAAPGMSVATTTNAENIETNEFNRNMENCQFVDNIYEFCDNNASMLV